MKRFSYIHARTSDEALSALSAGDAVIHAGGTDLLNLLKTRSKPKAPKAIVNIKGIPGLDTIREQGGVLKIGALCRLSDIEENDILRTKYPLLAQAAHAVGSPQIRNMGTIVGNICQEPRCWYYRYPENVFPCLRKGGRKCYALTGENRFHSIYGAARVSDPPCRTDCPGHVSIPAYLGRVRAGNRDEAAEWLLDHNPLPAITGRVCPHFCEAECNRADLDESVSIRNVERFMGDYILDHAERLITPPGQETGFGVAVIGAGPAGLSAAYYLRKSGHRVTVFERTERAGGMLAHVVPAYRLPRTIVERSIKAVERMGVRFKLKFNVGEDLLLVSIRRDFDAVFLSTGAWAQPTTGIEGEHLTQSGLEFLNGRRTGRDEVAGKKIVVIGGGNVAVDVGITAKRLGAADVTLVCLERREEMPAFASEIEQALEEGVKLIPSRGPRRIIQKDERVKGIELVGCSSVFDEKGVFCPAMDDSIKEDLEADHVIMAVGQKTDLSYLGADSSLKIENGLINVHPETQKTNIPGLLAGGDVTTGPGSVIDALAAGRRAALEIDKILVEHGKERTTERKGLPGGLLSFHRESLEVISRVTVPKRPLTDRSPDEEDVQTLEWELIQGEAERCFNCGCIAVSPSDLAPALIALDASIITNKRILGAENVFGTGIMASTVLEEDELATGIEIPEVKEGSRQAFLKFRPRKTIDFPIVSMALVLTVTSGKVKEARIALSGVAPLPRRAKSAEAAIIGKAVNEKTAEVAGEAALSGALLLPQNRYIAQIVKTLVKRAILACK